MTSKNKTSQPDNTPATEDTSSDQKTLDAQAVEAAAADGEKIDELEEVTDLLLQTWLPLTKTTSWKLSALSSLV